jgi:predicted DCC family thiol-disulfide oxidoreductase YuxK
MTWCISVKFRFCPRPWKNAAYEVGAALRFAWVGRDAGKVDRLARGLSEAIRF